MIRSQHLGVTVLRVAAAAMIIIHGAARVRLGGVDDFGVFLAQHRVPNGAAAAWALTAVEIAGGLALALGRFVLPLCVWFAAELAAGIALVHFKNGWFVVGAGRNGMEYSVLLIAALASIALLHKR